MNENIDNKEEFSLKGERTSSGYDFYAVKDLTIIPGEVVILNTDISIEKSKDSVLFLIIRGPEGVKGDLMVVNAIGTTDGYDNTDENITITLRNLREKICYDGFNLHDIITSGGRWQDDFLEEEIGIHELQDMTKENTITIKEGERIIQGIFLK